MATIFNDRMKRFLTSPVPMWFMIVYTLTDIIASLANLASTTMGW